MKLKTYLSSDFVRPLLIVRVYFLFLIPLLDPVSKVVALSTASWITLTTSLFFSSFAKLIGVFPSLSDTVCNPTVIPS